MKATTLKRVEKAEQAAGKANQDMVRVTFSDGRTEVINFLDATLIACDMISLSEVLNDPDRGNADIVEVDLLDEETIPYITTLIQVAGLEHFKVKGEVYESKHD